MQQRLAAFDSQTGYGADQMKTTWAALKTARAARGELKAMFELAVGNGIQRARLEQSQQEAEDAVAALRETESQYEAQAAASAERELEMQQQYESQLMSLLSLAHANNNAGSSTQLVDDRLRSAHDVHDRMVEAHKKLSCENERLKAQLKNKATGAKVKKKAPVVSESEDEEDWMEESDSEEFDDHSSDSDWEEGPSKKRKAQNPPIARKKTLRQSSGSSVADDDVASDAIDGLLASKNLMQQAFDEERRQKQPALKEKSVAPTTKPAPEAAPKPSPSASVTPSLASLPLEAAEREEALTKLTVPVLKEMLRQQKLKVSGKKIDLVTRLMDASKGSPGRKSSIFSALYANEPACTCNLDDGSECAVCAKEIEPEAEVKPDSVDAARVDEQAKPKPHSGGRAEPVKLSLSQTQAAADKPDVPKIAPPRPSIHVGSAAASKADTATAKLATKPAAGGTVAGALAYPDPSARQRASAPPRPVPVAAARPKPKPKPQIDLNSVASAIASANAAASSVAKMQSTVSSGGKPRGIGSDEMRRRLDAFKQKKSVTTAVGAPPRRAFGTVSATSTNRQTAPPLGGAKRKVGMCGGGGNGPSEAPAKKARQPLHMPKHTHQRPAHSNIVRPMPR